MRVRKGHARTVARLLRGGAVEPRRTWFEETNGGTVYSWISSRDGQAAWDILRVAGYHFHLTSVPGHEGVSLLSVFSKGSR